MEQKDIDFGLKIIQERLEDMVDDLNMTSWTKDGISTLVSYHMLIINNQIKKLRSEIKNE